MTVTKLPRTRNKGMLSHCPPLLSWPNDTAIGPRRPRLELLRQATRNRQQHRMSDLSASSRRNIPNPAVQHPPLRSQAPRASGFSKHKAHKRTHHSTQRSNASNLSRKPSEQNEKLVVHDPSLDATRRPKASKVSGNSLTGKKGDAKSLKDDHIASPKPINWPAYSLAKARRLKTIRAWVHSLRTSHRIVDSVAKELMAYYGSEKYGDHPSARTLSRHAWQAVQLCEHEFGTDLRWGMGLGEEVWGSDHGKVERLIGLKMEGEESPGVGTVGESDLSEFEDEEENAKGEEEEGFWGEGGLGEDVEMAEAV